MLPYATFSARACIRAEEMGATRVQYNGSHAGVTMTDYEISRGTKFGAMSFTRKIGWIGKFLIAVCTFGFVYPNVMHD